jgi:hypothetical protein
LDRATDIIIGGGIAYFYESRRWQNRKISLRRGQAGHCK